MIEVLDPSSPDAPPVDGRPLPAVDHVSSQYWAAAARGEILYQECPGCGHRQFYPRPCCTACGADTDWKQACGRGTVYTFTVIRQNWAEPFSGIVPYVVAMVELEEGPRLMTNLTHCDPETVKVGTPVEAYVVKVEDGLGLPFWRPARDAAGGQTTGAGDRRPRDAALVPPPPEEMIRALGDLEQYLHERGGSIGL